MADKEAKLHEQVTRGETAKIVLKELDDAHAALRKRITDTFCQSRIEDDAGRKNLRLHMLALDQVINYFKHHVRTGEEAHVELTRLKDPNRFREMINARARRRA